MLCPYGHTKGTKVLDSRTVKNGRAVRRRRECMVCHTRFTTYEEMEMLRLVVIKRSGQRQNYYREKIFAGVSKALEKRPQERNIDSITQKIEYAIFQKGQKRGVISTRDIGKIILTHLAKVDEVAYLRFASVYKSFGSIQSFHKEVELLRHKK